MPQVLAFLERAIPWHRIPTPGTHLISHLRSADPVREATRASDFLLTVELSLGDVTIVSHTGRAAELLDFEANQIAVTLKTPAWFDEYLAWSLGRVPKTALTCRVFIINNQNLDLKHAQLYPVETSGQVVSSVPSLSWHDRPCHEFGFQNESQGLACWSSNLAAAWLVVSPRLLLLDLQDSTDRVEFQLEFAVVKVGGARDELSAEQILDWMDEGVPWWFATR